MFVIMNAAAIGIAWGLTAVVMVYVIATDKKK